MSECYETEEITRGHYVNKKGRRIFVEGLRVGDGRVYYAFHHMGYNKTGFMKPETLTNNYTKEK